MTEVRKENSNSNQKMNHKNPSYQTGAPQNFSQKSQPQNTQHMTNNSISQSPLPNQSQSPYQQGNSNYNPNQSAYLNSQNVNDNQNQPASQQSNNPNVFFNTNVDGMRGGGNDVEGISEFHLNQIQGLITLGNMPLMDKFDRLINSLNTKTSEINDRITANELKAEDRDLEVDRRFGALEEKLEAIESRITQGNLTRRGGAEKILWLRGYPMNEYGNPISMSQYRGVLPPRFFEWVQGVTKVGADSFKLRIKEGVECSYYRLGVLLAKHDADFRRAMPDFDTRTKKEHEEGCGFKQNRYYKETRGIDELEEQSVDFNQDETAGNGENNTVNF